MAKAKNAGLEALKQRILGEEYIILNIPCLHELPNEVYAAAGAAKSSGLRVHLLVEKDRKGIASVPNEIMVGMKHPGVIMEYNLGGYQKAIGRLSRQLQGTSPLYR